LLPAWTRRMIIAHLSYGAVANVRVTREALELGRTTTYPGGPDERSRSLESFAGRSASDCLASFAAASADLDSAWRKLPEDSWQRSYEDDPGLGTRGLSRLVALRLTELEVHHGDLGTGYGPWAWSSEFVEVCLPLRLAWLPNHHRARVDADNSVDGSWLFRSPTNGWLVTSSGVRCSVIASGQDQAADVVVDGSGADLLAYLLGREPSSPLEVHGDLQLFSQFKIGFPGP
jgi:maleylpyruvate isomerase